MAFRLMGHLDYFQSVPLSAFCVVMEEGKNGSNSPKIERHGLIVLGIQVNRKKACAITTNILLKRYSSKMQIERILEES